MSSRFRYSSEGDRNVVFSRLRAGYVIMMPIGVAAVVPTFNRAHYLSECLASVLSQSSPPSEVIVVDDGSTDDTRAIVASFGGSVTYVHQANAGKSVALNRALKRLSSDTVWIVDDDDIAVPAALEWLSDALACDPGAGFAFGNMEGFSRDRRGRRRRIRYASAIFDPEDLHGRELMRCSIFQPAMLVRRRCYEEVGPFDEQLPRAQDYDMLLRLTERFRAVHVDRVVFYQRSHSGARGPVSLRLSAEELEDRQKIFDRAVLRKAFERNRLSDFLPRDKREPDLDPALRFRALLRRSAAMSRRGLWTLGASDLSAALKTAGAHGIRHLPPDTSALLSSALIDVGNDVELREAEPLFRVLFALSKSALRRELVGAISWQLLLNGAKAMARRDLRSAMSLLQAYFRLTGGRQVPAHGWRLLGWLVARPFGIAS